MLRALPEVFVQHKNLAALVAQTDALSLSHGSALPARVSKKT